MLFSTRLRYRSSLFASTSSASLRSVMSRKTTAIRPRRTGNPVMWYQRPRAGNGSSTSMGFLIWLTSRKRSNQERASAGRIMKAVCPTSSSAGRQSSREKAGLTSTRRMSTGSPWSLSTVSQIAQASTMFSMNDRASASFSASASSISVRSVMSRQIEKAPVIRPSSTIGAAVASMVRAMPSAPVISKATAGTSTPARAQSSGSSVHAIGSPSGTLAARPCST